MLTVKQVNITRWKHSEFDKPLIFKEGINLILGKNGSGKTSFLRMLNEASLMQQQPLPALEEANGFHLVDITLKNDESEISIFNTKQNEAGVWSSEVLKDKVRYITSQRSINSGNVAKNALAQQIGDTTISNPGQTIDVAEEFNKAIIRELYNKIVEMSDDMSFLSDLENDYQKELVDFDKKIKIDPKKENAVYFMDHKEREVPISNLSSGEQEYLYFYSFLRRIQGDEQKIILIDEPELHLHSSQIRKLCELISSLSIKNQIIIATHSGEVLQHFLSRANIILLSKGTVEVIDNPEQMQKLLESTGLPIDPSVFTSRWICAENSPSVSLFGGGPTTPELLGWIFGRDLNKRYWSFGSNRDAAKGYGDGINSATANSIEITAILDGDKLIKSPSDYPPKNTPEPTKDVAYFSFWEIENIFLSPNLLNNVISESGGKNGAEQFWDKVTAERIALLTSIRKTIAKNSLRHFSPDRYIGENTENDVVAWKREISELNLDLSLIDAKFDEVIAARDWKWVPGKESLKYVIELQPDFWKKIRLLQQENKLKKILADVPLPTV